MDYDFVIDIDQLRKANEGWPIFISQSRLMKLLDKNQQAIMRAKSGDEEAVKGLINSIVDSISLSSGKVDVIVSVLGLYNKGKTFVVNSLAGPNVRLRSDFKYNTKGLSFLTSQPGGPSNVVWLDTAGTSSPVTSLEETDLADRKATELFIQDIVFNISDILMVVVNELTWSDQEFIEVLHRGLVEATRIKLNTKLFVIHNYHHVHDERDLISVWRKCVVSVFKGRPVSQEVFLNNAKHTGRYFYQPAVPNQRIEVLHFFLANAKSSVGQRLNPVTFELLRQLINNSPLRTEAKDTVLQKVIKAAGLNIGKYCEGDAKFSFVPFPSDVQRDATPDAYTTGWTYDAEEDLRIINQSRIFGSFCLLRAEGTKLRLHNAKVDFDGFHYSLDRKYTPARDCFEDDNNFYVVIDVPGVENINVNSQEVPGSDRVILEITGHRRLYCFPGGNKEERAPYSTWTFLERGQRGHGAFKYEFRLPRFCHFNNYVHRSQNGVLQLTFPKMNIDLGLGFKTLNMDDGSNLDMNRS